MTKPQKHYIKHALKYCILLLKQSTFQVWSIEVGVNLTCTTTHTNQYTSNNIMFLAMKR